MKCDYSEDWVWPNNVVDINKEITITNAMFTLTKFQQELVPEAIVLKLLLRGVHAMDLDPHLDDGGDKHQTGAGLHHQDGVDDDHCSHNLQHKAVKESHHPFLDVGTGLHHQGAADGDGQGAADRDGRGPGGLLLPVCESEEEKEQQSQNCGPGSVVQLGAALHDLDKLVLSHGHSALFYQGPDKLAALNQGGFLEHVAEDVPWSRGCRSEK